MPAKLDEVMCAAGCDFFFILACLAFFTAGLVQRAADADDKSVILDAFVFA